MLEKLRKETQRWIRENRGAGFLPEAMMKRLAGEGTIYEMIRSADFPTGRIISTAEMASRRNPEDVQELIDRMSADHPAIRYWAATGLAIRGEDAREAIPRLTNMLSDEFGNNRIAAAEALCRMGVTEKPLKLLVEEMNHENEWVQLHALNAMQSLGDKIQPVEKEILRNDIGGDSNHYLRHAYRHLIKELKPGWSDYMSW